MKKRCISMLLIASMTTTYVIHENEVAKQQKIAAKKQIEIKLEKQKAEEEKLRKERDEEERKIQLKLQEEKRIAEEKERIASVSFDSNNLLIPSKITVNEMYGILKGTGLEDVSETLVKAENIYGINAIVLAALAAEESGWGNASRAKKQNNLTGYAVYNSVSRGGTFSNRDECILLTAKLLSQKYLKHNGEYYNGSSLEAVNIKYSSNKKWARNIDLIASELMEKYEEKFR